MREAFIEMPRGFHHKTRELIGTANAIIEKLASEGYTLTLRQLYYRLVAAGVIPNKPKEYKKLGEAINNARMCGLVDWDSIEDRTRTLRGTSHHDDPSDIVATAASAFRIDKWERQSHRVEVWVEKDALAGVLNKACTPLDVDWFSCRGNTSASAIYRAATRFCGYIEGGQQPVIVHLGDHDPSGIDMTRDIFDRLTLMVTQKTGQEITVNRVALNMDQIRRFNCPPNPAKTTDSRFESYRKKFGVESWELDALELPFLDNLITESVLKYRDEDQWAQDVETEEAHRDDLARASKEWPEVAYFVENRDHYLKLEQMPDTWAAGRLAKLPALKKELRNFVPSERGERLVTIVDNGMAVNITANDFRKMAGARDKKPKKSSSHGTKKPKKS